MAVDVPTLLDFSLAPRRFESVRFDLLDEDLNKVGEVHPVGAPTMKIERAAQVKRSLSNVVLFPPESQRVTYRTRIRPIWVFDDGTFYPMGVFHLNDETIVATGEEPLEIPVMGDGIVLYREPLTKSFSVRPGDSVLDKLYELHGLATHPAPYVAYDHITDLSKVALAWPAGTLLSDVMEELADSAGVRVWFNAKGTLRFDLASDETDGTAGVIDLTNHIEGSLKISYSNEDTPNRWIARDNAVDFSIEGVYDLPDDSPHSAARRGRVITQVVEIPGLIGQDAADRIARQAALDEEFPYKTATAEFPARPDLDCFVPVRLEGGQVWKIDTIDTELISSGTTTVEAQVFWENPDSRFAEPRTTLEGSDPVPGSVPPLNPQLLWSPEFRKYWRGLTRKQKRRLRRWFDALEQQRLERLERRRRRAAAQRRKTAQQRRKRRPKHRRAGRVQSFDPHHRIATVLLDGDSQGDEVPVYMETDIPGPDQRVMVNFNSPTPSVSGIEGGINRMLGYVQVTDNETISGLGPVAVTDLEVEVTITQPSRVIAIYAAIRVSVTGGSSVLWVEGQIQRDDGEGTYSNIGPFDATIGFGNHGTGNTLSGYVFDKSPDPGIYSYRMRVESNAQPYRIAGAAQASSLLIFDVGADLEATFE